MDTARRLTHALVCSSARRRTARPLLMPNRGEKSDARDWTAGVSSEPMLGGISVASSGALWLLRQPRPLEPPVRYPTRANHDPDRKSARWRGRAAPAAAGAGGAEVVAFAPGVDRHRTLACGGRAGASLRLPPFPAPPSQASASPCCCRGVCTLAAVAAAPTGVAAALSSSGPASERDANRSCWQQCANSCRGRGRRRSCGLCRARTANIKKSAVPGMLRPERMSALVPLSGFFLMGMGGQARENDRVEETRAKISACHGTHSCCR